MKKLLRAFGLVLGMGASLVAAPVSPPAGNFIVNVSTNQKQQVFNVSSGTIGNIIITGTCTGAGCGGGSGTFTGLNASGQPNLASSATFVGGTNVTLSQSGSSITITAAGGSGPSGTITPSPQFQIGQFSASGSSNVITGISSGSWVENTSTLQPGATFYVSSGTVANQFITGGGNFGSNAFMNIGGSGFSAYTSASPNHQIMGSVFANNASAGNVLTGFVFTDQTGSLANGFSIDPFDSHSVSSRLPVFLSSGTTLSGEVTFSSGVILGGTEGTAGQVFTSNGAGSSPTWSAAGSNILPTTNTWTGGNTFTSSTTFSSSVVLNAGNGNASITENGLTGQIVLSTAGAGVTVGHCAAFGSSMSIVDAGACGSGGGGTPGGSNFQVQVASAGAFGGTPLETVFQSSVTFNSVSSFTITSVSNITSTGTLWNLAGSSITVSSLTVTGPMNVAGSGTASIQLAISGSTYSVTSSSSVNTVGHTAVWSSTNGTLIDGGTGGGGTPGGSPNQVQYNSGGSFGGSNNFQFNGTSITIASSMAITTNGTQVASPALVNMFGAGLTGTTDVFAVGSSATSPLFEVQANNVVKMNESGAAIGNLQIGGRSDGDAVGDAFSIYETANTGGGQGMKIYDTNGNLDIFTASVSQGGKNGSLNFITGGALYGASGITQVAISSQSVTISTLTTIGSGNSGTYSLTVSTLATGGKFFVDISTTGHLNAQTVAGLTVTSCGANASVAGSDIAGIITTGAASPTACTLTFAKPYVNTPVCLCGANGATACDPTSTSNAAVTFTLSVTQTSIKYICIGSD